MIDEDPSPANSPPASMPAPPSASVKSVFISTLTSLSIVLVLLLAVRWVLPSLLESSRYSWHRGQLKAEHEAAGEQLRNVSLDSLSRVSELVSQRATPSVVHINVRQILDSDDEGSQKSTFSSQGLESLKVDGQGSGVIVDGDGYVVTNFHVLEGGEAIEVRLSDDSRREARIIGIDRVRDLAVLKIDQPDLPPVTWGNSDIVTVGAPVWAIGSPFGLHGSITFGILSSKHRVDLSESRYYHSNHRIDPHYSDLMQSDVAVNPGNSGGPLLNGQGELIGINTAILGESYRGVSFSIPSNIVKKIYDEIREKAKTPRGWLGVHLENATILVADQSVESNNQLVRGVAIRQYARFGQSPARLAGLMPGDIIVGFNEQSILTDTQLTELIGKARVGSTANFQLIRDGERLSIDVELGARHVELEITAKEAGN